MSSEKREDEIRVIEEPVEEVVRLDVDPMSPIAKKGKILDGIMHSRVESEEEVTSAKKVVDPEREWLEEQEEASTKNVPTGWFFLLAMGLLGVLAWAFLQTTTSKGQDQDPGGGTQVGAARSLPSATELREAETHFEEMERVVAKFLAAETVEEMGQYVRHRARVLPMMEKYYQSHPFKSLTFEEANEYHMASLEKRPFIALNVDVKETQSEPVRVLLEDLPGGMLVDWESFVCYQPMEPEEYIAKRPTGSFSFRVYAEKDHFHAYEFSDEEEFECYRLTFRDSESILYGFVKRGSMVDEKFRKSFPEEGNQVRLPLILKVRFLEEGKAKRSVLIEDLESKLWAFARNPDELAPAAN